MPFAYVPIALGLAGAVAITLILIEVIPRLAEDRERSSSAERRRRRVRALPVAVSGHSSGYRDYKVNGEGGKEAKEWGYEIRKRKNGNVKAGKGEQPEQDRLVPVPRLEIESQTHILANPSDFELSSPDHGRSSPLSPPDDSLPLITFEKNASKSTLAPARVVQTDSSLFSPPPARAHSDRPSTLCTAPQRSQSAVQASSLHTFAEGEDVGDDGGRWDDKNQNETTIEKISSNLSSPLLIDHSTLSPASSCFGGSPSFSEDVEPLDLEGTRARSNDLEFARERDRERSQTWGSEPYSLDDGEWTRMSDYDDDAVVVPASAEALRDVTKRDNDGDEWENVTERRKGLGLGL